MTSSSATRSRALPAAVAGFVAAGLLSVGAPAAAQETPSSAPPVAAQGYSAEIRRTAYGVPHIKAADWGSLGFGSGHAQAEDVLCVIAETVVTVSAQRSRWFGADSATAPNVRSDLFFQKANDARYAEQLLEGTADGVDAPSRNVRDLVRGFAAGYNARLAEVGVDGITDPACRGKGWVRPITEQDMWRTVWASMVRASSAALRDGIVAARPPAAAPQTAAGTAASLTSASGSGAAQAAQALAATGGPEGLGSNAYGLGSEVTASGAGMLLANPHFPWEGPERFYRQHLTIPGVYDVEGASLIGDPIVEIGHNATLGWSHTVSTARRFVWHRLALVPGDPTSYVVDGKPERMTRRDVTVQVPGPDGALVPVTRTFYDTRYGPVVTVPGSFDWTSTAAYAITDVNATNARALDGWIAMGQAGTVRELRAALDRSQHLPWVNTIAADANGEAMYADHTVIPRVTDALASACILQPFAALYAGTGQAVLDGSRSACGLPSDEDAAAPGIFAPDELPVLITREYVTNSNDSYWLSNPDQPLTGFPRIIGDEATARSLRTRLGLVQVQQRLAGTDGLPGDGFTVESLWQVMFSNRVHGGELVRDELVALCRANPTATATDGATVSLQAACDALAGWDLKVDLDSRGAHVFREFVLAGGLRFSDAFSVDDPVRTPRVLATADPAVLTALADAVQRLAGVPLDAPLGAIQTEARGSERIPIHGGRSEAGVFNFIRAPLVPGVGYPSVEHGTSYVMAVEFTADGPRGRQILTYSQSTDPTSPHFADQTRLYSQKGWDTIKYTEEQILADPALRRYVVSQTKSAAAAFDRLDGADRFATAAAVAVATFDSADTVLLANGLERHLPDALAGNYLAGYEGAPVLLTTRDRVPASTQEALDALGARRIIVLGGPAAVSQAQRDRLAQRYSVERVGGADRYETAALIATTPPASHVVDGTAIVARGDVLADALVAGPVAYAGRFPVLLTRPSGLGPHTREAMTELGITDVIVAGGAEAVRDAVVEQLRDTGGDDAVVVTRLAGGDRQGTAVAFADFATGRLGFSRRHVELARGDLPADALAAGPHAGVGRSVILLTASNDRLGAVTRDHLARQASTLEDGHVIGGAAAVSAAVVAEATAAANSG